MKLKTKLLFAVPILLLIIGAASTNAYAWDGGYGPSQEVVVGMAAATMEEMTGWDAVATVGDTMQAFKMLFTIMTTTTYTTR